MATERVSIGGRRIGRGAVAAPAVLALFCVLIVVTAASPVAGALCAPLLVAAAIAILHRATTARLGARAVALFGLVALAALVTLGPRVAAVSAPVALALGAVARAAARSGRIFSRLLAVAASVACLATLVALGVWPVTTTLVALVALVVALAWRAPPLALAGAILLVGFEGSIKLLLGAEPTPLPASNRAAGAASIDVALFSAVAGVVIADRFATPKRIWSRATRLERASIALLGAWLLLSAVQILQGGQPIRGLHGFRLFQAYTTLALASAAIFARPELRRRALRGLLAVGLVVSAYAAFRVLFGMSHAERQFATSVPTVTQYGHAVRAIGSFSSAIGLSSFLAPLTAFAFVAGYLDARVRALAWTVGACGIVGLLGSYSRASLFGVALGLGAALVLLAVTADVPARRKLAAAGALAVVLLATYGGIQVASHASPQLRARAHGVLHPFSDKSMQLRYETWRRAVRSAASKPLGRGVGTVGGASSPDRAHVVTTDNSFLKVLIEQGVIGVAMFLAAMLSAVILLARRLRAATGDARTLGLPALAGFVTFLGISATGETVEQPGKVVAWVLLGMAVAQALGRLEPREGERA